MYIRAVYNALTAKTGSPPKFRVFYLINNISSISENPIITNSYVSRNKSSLKALPHIRMKCSTNIIKLVVSKIQIKYLNLCHNNFVPSNALRIY